MTDLFKANELPLSKIFSDDYQFTIPEYQRPYSWTTEETEKLFEDLYKAFKDDDKSYFLSSIILSGKDKKYDVIDGQQRLTTLTILWAVLGHNAKDEKIHEQDLRKYILQEKDVTREEIEDNPRLHLRTQDRSFFENIQHIKIEDLLKKEPKSNSQKNIKLNTKKLNDLVSEKFDSDNKLIKFTQFLTGKCFIVLISTTDLESAYRIFSIMNTRGLDLQSTDILKATIIGKLNKNDRDAYSRKWEDMEDIFGRETFNDLFRYIRMIYIKKKPQHSLVKDFETDIIKQNSSKDMKTFIDETLGSYFDAFSTIMKNNKALDYFEFL